MTRVATCCIVAGHVQGVFFRKATQNKAQELQLNGYAKNLADGCVEVWIEGEFAAVEALCAWLWQGSEKSVVTQVICQRAAQKNYENFSIL